MENSIDQKGAILTHLSEFWFKLMQKKIPSLPTHFLSMGIPSDVKQRLPSDLGAQLDSRSMVVKRLRVLPIESIVRGYITGSAWTSYQKDGTFVGISLPAGLQESQKFDKPIWTPSTKAEVGGKDENITAQQGIQDPFCPEQRDWLEEEVLLTPFCQLLTLSAPKLQRRSRTSRFSCMTRRASMQQHEALLLPIPNLSLGLTNLPRHHYSSWSTRS